MKERSRSAYTLALVMVVLAMLITVAGANAAMSRTLTNVIERQTGGSLQVIAPGAFEPDVGGRLAAIDGVRAVTPVQFGQTDRLIDDGSARVGVTIIDPATYFDVAGFAWVDGDDELGRRRAERRWGRPRPGRHVSGGGRGPRRRRPAAHERGRGGVHRRGHLRGGRPRVRRRGRQPGRGPVRGGTPQRLPRRRGGRRRRGHARRTRSATELGGEYDLIIDTPDSTKDFAFGQLRGFFSLAYVILIAAAVAGLLGLANTLAVSVLARTHEIGVLRSAGTLRSQIRQMVLVEAITLALVAFVLAVPLGLLLTLGTSATVRGAVGASVELTVPWGFLVPLLVVTLVVAALAALIPARRAAGSSRSRRSASTDGQATDAPTLSMRRASPKRTAASRRSSPASGSTTWRVRASTTSA